MILLARAYPPSLGPPKHGSITSDLALTGPGVEITPLLLIALMFVIAGIVFLVWSGLRRRRHEMFQHLDWEDPESGELWPASRESGRGAISRRGNKA